VIATFGLSFEFIVPALTNYYGRDKFPCDLTLSLTVMFLPIGVGPLAVRLVMFANRGEWQDALKDTSMDEFSAEKFEKRSFWRNLASTLRYKGRKMLSCMQSNSASSAEVSAESFGGLNNVDLFDDRSSVTSRKVKFFLQSRFYGFLLQFLVTVFSLGILAAAIRAEDSSYGGKGCSGCELSDAQFNFIIVLGFVIYSFFISMVIALRKKSDPLGIKRELKLAAFTAGTLMIIGALFATLDVGKLRSERVFDFYYFLNIGIFFGLFWLVILPVIQSFRIDRARRERRMSSTSTLEDALQPNTPLHKAFCDYLVTEWSIENALYLNAVDKFRNSEDDLAKRALDIYTTFIDPNGMLTVNISHKTQSLVKKSIDPVVHALREAGTKHSHKSGVAPLSAPLVSKDIFDVAYKEVYQLLYSDSWFRFQNSSKYNEVDKV